MRPVELSDTVLAGIIPWAEACGGLQSLGLQRTGYDWVHTHCIEHSYSHLNNVFTYDICELILRRYCHFNMIFSLLSLNIWLYELSIAYYTFHY